MKKSNIFLKSIRLALIGLSSIAFAQIQPVYSELSNNQQVNDDTSILQQISDELTTLGASLGFNIRTGVPDSDTIHSDLSDVDQTIKDEFALVQDLFATLSINESFLSPNAFIANPIYSKINDMANMVFKKTDDNSNNQNNSTNNLDSLELQETPIAQAIQNILSITPDDYCFILRPSTDSSDCTNKDWQSGCNYNYTQSKIYANAWGFNTDSKSGYATSIDQLFIPQGQAAKGICEIVMSNSDNRMNNLASIVVSKISDGSLFFPQDKQSNYNQLLLNQLDSSLLITPLLYDNSNADNTTSQSYGLVTKNAQQAAENFIKYVTGAVLPPDPMSKKDFDEITKNIYEASDIYTQLKSFRSLSKYVLGLRVYSARISVAFQNIYEILGARKKIPNTDSNDANQATSQALNEFKMATYRLYNPNIDPNNLNNTTDSQNKPWQQMINEASPARVQKETAILLAEINYQLYLMRKQQDKLILTNSVMLLQSALAPTLELPDTSDGG